MAQKIVIHRFPDRGRDGTHEYYLLFLPEYGEPGFYRQVSSYNAFFYGWNKRIQKLGAKAKSNHEGQYIYYPTDEFDYNIIQASLKKYAPNYKSHEFVKVFHSLWEFYEHIGFDYKTKKYTKSPE